MAKHNDYDFGTVIQKKTNKQGIRGVMIRLILISAYNRPFFPTGRGKL